MFRKIVYFIILLFVFMFINRTINVYGEEACIPDNKPIIENAKDIFYKIGSSKPDYLVGIILKDSCGTMLSIDKINVDDKWVNLNKVGVYPLYYQSQLTSVEVKVYVFQDIPKLEGVRNFNVEINDAPPNYLEGVTATDVYTNADLTSEIIVDDSQVDYTKLGSYNLTYRVKDSRGNETVKVVKVNVIDTIPPQIENLHDLTIEVNTNLNTYDFWLDVNIKDNSNRPVTKELDRSKLNIGVIGEYEITYIVRDEAKNETRKSVKVKVVDTKAPEIKYTKDLKFLVNTELTKWMFIEHLQVSDNYDKNLTVNDIEVYFDQVDVTKPGVYPVMYFLSDSSGNYDTKMINVRIYDEDSPVIINAANIRVPVGTKSVDYLANVSCIDETDGNLTNKIIVNDKLVNLNKVGSYPLQYSVFDSSGNYTIVVVYVLVYDADLPVITGIKDLTIEVNLSYDEAFFLKDITAYDNIDGDITSWVTVDLSNLDTTKLGTYQITYTVIDSSDNQVSETVLVTVTDTTPPEITGVKDVTIKINEEFDVEKFKQGIKVVDNYDGEITDFVVKGFIDTSKVGSYTLTIEAKDSFGNKSSVTCNLIVEGEDVKDKKSADYIGLYILSGMGLVLLVTGFLGYRTRKRR